MHANEVETDEALVRRVLGLQMRRGRVVAGGRCPGGDRASYYLHTYPVIVQEARRWLAEVLSDSE